ncbi:MAG: adenylate/guanylate cyclase domain-containing protein [Actinomycetota bacterium]
MTNQAVPAPTGDVTFVFTDVEGSTRLWAADASSTARSLESHDELIKAAVGEHRGYVFGWAGDHFRAAFADPTDAVMAATSIQTRLAEHDWQGGPALKVRIGIHRGEATQRDGDYFGPVPNTAARVEALAHGGQTLMTDAVQRVVAIESSYLGSHRLRDVPDPVAVHQVGIGSHRPLRSTDPTLTSLPAPGSSIIGRSGEIRQIRALLETATMVTLTGIGGCGKTRLAVEIGFQELPGRRDGCYFADLTSVSEPAELPAAIARAVRFELAGAGAVNELVRHLASREALLVLDNCEHILDACAEFVEALIQQSSSTVVLATTRQRLGVDGELVVAVPSLDHDTPESPAIELFLERAQAADPSVELSGPDLDVIADICHRLDGMPLAIELAAARIAVLSPAEILERMADRFRLLSGGIGRHRRRTLQATLDWSYDLLDADEQRFFRRIGLFVGSFDLPAAAAVGEMDDYDALDTLESLVSKNLLIADTDAGGQTRRYRLLETVRIYAGDELARAEDASGAQAAYVEHYRSLAEAESHAVAASLDRAMELEWQWPNIASTLDHLCTDHRWLDAAGVAFGSFGLWDSQIPATEGVRWLERIHLALNDELAAAAAAGVAPDPQLVEYRDWIQYILAMLLIQLDDFPEVFRLFEGLLALPGATPGAQAQAGGVYAFLCCRQYPERVPGLVDRGRDIVRDHQLGNHFLTPLEWGLGCLAMYSGHYEDARATFQHALDLLDGVGSRSSQYVMCGLSLAAADVMCDRPQHALDVLDGYPWWKSVWDSSSIVRAVALIDLDRVSDAADLIVTFGYDALLGRLARRSNDTLVGLAALAIHRGEDDHAWTLLQSAASPRSPFLIVLAEHLADRIGKGAELRHMHRRRVVPLRELDASDALRAELTRLRHERD